ncbi:MAG: PAS domain-containing protein [Patescibacteria group bacterium]
MEAPVNNNKTFAKNKKNQADLQEKAFVTNSLVRFYSATEHSFSGIFILDKNFNIVYLNEAAAKNHGRARTEITAQNFFEFIKYSPSAQKEKILDSLKEGSWEGKIQINETDKSKAFQFFINNLPKSNDEKYFLVIENELFDSTFAAQKVKESEERYKVLFEASADGILIADIETKKFIDANPAICKILEYSRQELIGLGLKDIHPPDKIIDIVAEFEAQARGDKTLAENIPCVKKSGKIIYCDINTSLIMVEGKKCNVGFFRDVSLRKKIDEETKEKNLELEKFNKLIVSREFKMIELKNKIKKLESHFKK